MTLARETGSCSGLHPFLTAHATHPDAHMALALAAAQLQAQWTQRQQQHPGCAEPTLGFVYITDRYESRAESLLTDLQQRWPGVDWVGGVGLGVVADEVEYFDEPALVVMLADVPRSSFALYSGERPLSAAAQSGAAFTALVHADGQTPDMTELLPELAARTGSGYLFGGLMASRGRQVQFCAPAGQATGVYEGGVSGVAFGADVALLSRVTQGCQPIGPTRRVDAARDNIVIRLEGTPALECLIEDLGIDLSQPRAAVPRLRSTLVGLTAADQAVMGRGGQFGPETQVRHLIGLDPLNHAVAVADRVEAGMQLTFCTRNAEAARRDLVRICAEIREELSPGDDDEAAQADNGVLPPVPQTMVGAIYVSCTGRGGSLFGGESAELQILRHALGPVPLVGFFAAGEIAHHHLYGYTGVLTVFTRPMATAV